MRAAVLTEYGRPPAVQECADPTPQGSALVEVRTVPITPLDLLCATGASYFGEPPLPYVPGVQGVGVVRSGESVPPGTRVWFPTSAGMAPGDGSLAEQVAVPEEVLVPLPGHGVTDAEVAGLGLSAVAAWMMLTWRAALQPGEQVLVLGAGGTVGQVAVQVARLLGARRVVAACRSEGARARARRAGADAVVGLHEGEDTADRLAARLAEACEGPVDVVIDPLWGVPAAAALRVLGERGRLVNLGSAAGASAELDSAALRSHTAAVLGYTNNALPRRLRDGALLAVLDHAAAGRIRVDTEVVPLDAVAEAWQRQADGAVAGRMVIEVTPDAAAQ